MYYGGLFVDRHRISRLRDGVSERVLAAFTDDWYSPRQETMGEYWKGDADPEDEGKPQLVHEWRVTAVKLADRLDALGVQYETVSDMLSIAAIDAADSHRAKKDDPAWEKIVGADVDEVVERLERVTIEGWLDLVRSAHERGQNLDFPRIREIGSDAEIVDLPDVWPEEYMLRIYCIAFPYATVRLDLTEFYEDNLIEPGPAILCSSARSLLAEEAASNSSTVVLVEGKSDARALDGALQVLAPHLVDLIRVMDFERKAEGGASALASTVRAFAAAGITNRVVAIFDNDTAAIEITTALKVSTLPQNIFVRHLPAIELLQDYPTIGPVSAPGGEGPAIWNADVNGLAGSIELYFGVDVLQQDEYTLTPIQWTSYMAKSRRYQGEVLDKAALQEKFRQKCDRALAEGTLEGADWSGMQAVVDVLRDVLGTT